MSIAKIVAYTVKIISSGDGFFQENAGHTLFIALSAPRAGTKPSVRADKAIIKPKKDSVPPPAPQRETHFKPMMAAMSKAMKNSRAALADSLRNSMPSTTVPTAPMPVQTG